MATGDPPEVEVNNPGDTDIASQKPAGTGTEPSVDGDGTDISSQTQVPGKPAPATTPDAAVENQAPSGGLPSNVNVG